MPNIVLCERVHSAVVFFYLRYFLLVLLFVCLLTHFLFIFFLSILYNFKLFAGTVFMRIFLQTLSVEINVSCVESLASTTPRIKPHVKPYPCYPFAVALLPSYPAAQLPSVISQSAVMSCSSCSVWCKNILFKHMFVNKYTQTHTHTDILTYIHVCIYVSMAGVR